MKCPYCGLIVSEELTRCPRCKGGLEKPKPTKDKEKADDKKDGGKSLWH